MECIHIHTKISSIIIHYCSYLVVQSKLIHTETQTPSHSQSPPCIHAHTMHTNPHTHTHTHTHTRRWIIPAWITSAGSTRPLRTLAHPEKKEIYIFNGQPGARVSFSVNGLNEPEILLSLWTDSVQSDLSAQKVGVSTSPPMSTLEEL